jgi:competence protein ComGC
LLCACYQVRDRLAHCVFELLGFANPEAAILCVGHLQGTLALSHDSVSLGCMFANVHRRAFTRTEVLAVIAVLFLILAIVLPAFAATKSESGRMVCFNNLRLIGRGVATWTADHNQKFSWRTRVEDGGTMQNPKPSAAWVEYLSLSNELVTPRILACPSDAGVRTARVFDYDPDGGLVMPGYRNNALSYPLHLDGSPDAPRSWLSGDRNLKADGSAGGCSAGVFNADVIYAVPQQFAQLRWTNAVHGDFGHVLTTDGQVEFTSSVRLREIILGSGFDDNGQTHFLRAR